MQTRTFSCLITDRRYGAPTLRFFEAIDAESAKAFAQRELLSSQHHLAIEVLDDDRLIFREVRPT